MKNLFLILLMSLPVLVRSQAGLVRIELEASLNSDIYHVVPCNDRGLFVFYETRETEGENHKIWYFTYYDVDLEPSWNASMPVVLGTEYKDYVLKDSLLYLFFLNEDKVKPGSENFQVMEMDLVNGISTSVSGTVPSESNYNKLLIKDRKAFLSLNLKNDQAGVFIIDLKTAEVAAYNILYPDQNFLEDICLDTVTGQLLCLVSNYLEKRQNHLYMQALDLSGRFLYDLEIQTKLEGKYLNGGKLYPLGDSSIMVLGSYGGIASRIPGGNEYFGVESTGLFSTRILNGKQQFMNYFNFMELNNLRAGINARDFYRLQKKKVRESAEYSMNYELLFHEPMVHDSSMLLLMEAYYPEFQTVSDISYDYWGRPVTQTYTVFNGYRIFNTILAAFDGEGALTWDNSIEMNLSPSGQLMKRASYFFDGEPALLFYNDGYRISYRVFYKNAELEGFSKMDLKTLKTGDKISAAGYNTMDHWYGKYFIAYGYQSIQNNLLADKNERTVFYVNKIALD